MSTPTPSVRVSGGERPETASAAELEVRGVVQGVGFRPFLHRLAMVHGLAGWARNESGAVRIVVEGGAEAIAGFTAAVREEAPPLARIDALESRSAEPTGADGFRILESVADPTRRLPVSPDMATCGACEAELFDPVDRRYRYPFITCTDCGPRFTVIESMPYDRERTTMSAFRQCPACLDEYGTPGDRRYHSETNGCPECGPRLWFEPAADLATPAATAADLDAALPDAEAALAAAAALLAGGGILALRGLGGFHLAVDATEAAVARLRRRKAREAKPLAVMVRSLEQARALGAVGPGEARLLASRERPIVLIRLDPDAPLAGAVAPGLDTVGVMLAYTPLHLLLLDAVGRPLVMTSGNVSDEPICTGNDEARERLAGIADGFLLHDREIVARYDDSVLRVADGAPVFLRRSRGFAPLPPGLPIAAPVPLLAVGAHLKNTFTLAVDSTAYVSQHIGDLENLETLEHFRSSLGRFRTLFNVEPAVAVRDMHPGYLSTRIADELGLPRTLAVQHHHAHIAAVLAEHGRTDRVLGLAFDGTGYGEDGRVWGAEVLLADLVGCERVGRLRYAPIPGGDLAARRPWRCALGYLTLEPERAPAFERALRDVPVEELRVARRQCETGLNAPLASSMGRLFDAAAAVLGVRTVSRYEGHAPMELEALAGSRPAEPLPFPALEEDGLRVLDPLPLLAALGERAAAGDDIVDLAARFHESVAAAAAALAVELGEAHGVATVALGGGVFQNARLWAGIIRRLEGAGLEVLAPRSLSPNDGCISYGQAAVAAALLSSEGGS